MPKLRDLPVRIVRLSGKYLNVGVESVRLEGDSPPAQFDVIGERIIQLLSPVRSSIVGGVSFAATWQPGEMWSAPRADEAQP